MSMDGEKRHFFGDHPGEPGQGMNQFSNYQVFINAFNTVNPKDYGLEIWNCSRRTAMDAFPRYNLEDALCLV